MNKKDFTILDFATSLASIHFSKGKHRLVAIVTDKKGRTISMGANSYDKTHPLQKYYASKSSNPKKEMIHAEIDALVVARKKKKVPYAIYIARVNKHGEARLAKPCECCEIAIKAAGIEKVYYTK